MTDAYATLAAHLDTTLTVAVVTTRRDGSPRATPIWAVVVDGTPYVRAAYGEQTGWFRRALTGREVAFSLGDGTVAERDPDEALADPRVAVAAERIAEDDAVQDAVSAAFEAKYLPRFPAHVPPVVSAEARRHTLALRPA